MKDSRAGTFSIGYHSSLIDNLCRPSASGSPGELPKKKTNFDRITKSPEKLADFIYLVSYSCSICKKIYGGKKSKECPFKECLDNELDALYWLNKETK